MIPHRHGLQEGEVHGQGRAQKTQQRRQPYRGHIVASDLSVMVYAIKKVIFTPLHRVIGSRDFRPAH